MQFFRQFRQTVGAIGARLARMRERGIMGIDDIAAIIIAAIVLAGATYLFGMGLRLMVTTFQVLHEHGAVNTTLDQIATDAQHSRWVGIPSTDIYGASNTNGHEIDFYTVDSNKNPYFWAWYYDTNAQTLQKYTYTDPASRANLKTAGQQAWNITGFSAASLALSTITNAELSAIGVTSITPQNVGYGYTVSNNIIKIVLSTADEVVPLELAPAVGPTGFYEVVGTYLKPGPLTVTPTSQIATVGKVSQIGVTEEYYTGLYTINSGTCGGIATISPGSATAQSTTSVPFNITGVAPGNCQFSVTDDHGGQVNVTLQVTGTLNVSPANVNEAVGASTIISASEDNYFSPINASSSCSGYATVSPTSQNAKGTTAVTFSVTGNSAGSCTFTISDNHGQSVTVTVTVTASPQSWPPAIVFAAQGTTIVADVPTTPRTYIARLLNSALGGGVALAASNCNAVAYNVDGSGNPTTAIPAGTVDPYNTAYSVDAAGCWNGQYFVVTENGYTSAFTENTAASSCSNYLSPGQWTPTSATGPTATQVYSAGQTAVSSCSVVFNDANAKSTTSYAAVMFPNPMYAQVNSTDTSWTYDCFVYNSRGQCVSGGFSGSSTSSYVEYSSVNQGASWQVVATCGSSTTCPYPAPFVETKTSCTSDVNKGTSMCGAVSSTSSAKWSPYAPPNSSGL